MTISFGDFKKLDIRIGTIESVEKIPGADKLLKFVIDLGSEKRQIVAGMAPWYPDPSVLIGKQLTVLLNLEPRKFMGYESQGMILAADDGQNPVFLVPEKTIAAGSVVR